MYVCVFRIDLHEMLGRVSKVLSHHPKLVDKFNQLLPPGMPLSTFKQADAEVFVAFVCYTVHILMCLHVTSQHKEITIWANFFLKVLILMCFF